MAYQVLSKNIISFNFYDFKSFVKVPKNLFMVLVGISSFS